MKLLNLDEVLPIQRVVTIGGVNYSIKEQSLGDLLEVVRRGRKAPTDEAEALEQTIGSAQRLLPDCPEDVLRSLTAKQLSALISFANASEESLQEQPDSGKQGKQSKQGKK